MALGLLFVLGVANFAMHKAVLESRHPLMVQALQWFRLFGGRFGLALEFIVLLGAMLMVSTGATGWAVAYVAYSLLNALSAWLVLTGRI